MMTPLPMILCACVTRPWWRHRSWYPYDSNQYLWNGWTDFHEIWCGCYAIVDDSKSILFKFPQLVLPTWRMLKIVRWDMMPWTMIPCACASPAQPNPTLPNLTTQPTSLQLISACTHSITSEWLDRFSWNLVRLLCHCRLLYTNTF
jgi:hypothetical protein